MREYHPNNYFRLKTLRKVRLARRPTFLYSALASTRTNRLTSSVITRTERSLAIHPYFSDLKPQTKLDSFPILDPIRRYKDFDFYNHTASFLHNPSPLKPKRLPHPLKPQSNRAALLKTLLSKAKTLKIYTRLNPSLSLQKALSIQAGSSPRTLFASRTTLRLLRRERRLYIRMLPQMRLSYKTLKSLRDADVRYSVIRNCYFSSRSRSSTLYQPKRRFQSPQFRLHASNEKLFYLKRQGLLRRDGRIKHVNNCQQHLSYINQPLTFDRFGSSIRAPKKSRLWPFNQFSRPIHSTTVRNIHKPRRPNRRVVEKPTTSTSSVFSLQRSPKRFITRTLISRLNSFYQKPVAESPESTRRDFRKKWVRSQASKHSLLKAIRNIRIRKLILSGTSVNQTPSFNPLRHSLSAFRYKPRKLRRFLRNRSHGIDLKPARKSLHNLIKSYKMIVRRKIPKVRKLKRQKIKRKPSRSGITLPNLSITYTALLKRPHSSNRK